MISADRLAAQFARLKTITAPGKGINRLAFTDSDWEGRAYIISLMQAAGLSIREDAFGNVIGHYAGLDETLHAILIGSHGDSVPEGGNYDGIVGILAAIEVARSLHDDGVHLVRPLEIVLFMCEESSRFSAATLGSRAMRGELSIENLHSLHDRENNTLYDVLKLRGLDPDNIATARYTAPLRACLELHIEQGKVLEHSKKQIGIVTGIAAPTRYICHVEGSADHSGATPMGLRHDALCAAAEIVLAVEELARAEKGAPVVGTVGIADVTPGVMNVIPGRVRLGLDIRSISAAAREHVVTAIKERIAAITTARGLTYQLELVSSEPPAVMADELVELFSELAAADGLEYMRLPSGAGHDSMHWADYAPTGMLFIPCRDGISHNPAEFAELADIVAGTRLLARTVAALGEN